MNNSRGLCFLKNQQEESTEEVKEIVSETLKGVEEQEHQRPMPVIVNVPRLNVRKNPSLKSEVLCIVTEDAILRVIGLAPDNWLYISTDKNIEGYVMSEFVKEV
jgi:hypothetical protein